MEQIESDFSGKGYGDFKTAVGEAVVENLRPIQNEYERIIKDKAYMEETWKKADAFAQQFSQRTLDKVMKKIGYIK
jgi:tryptophanyl-tRNA synthetase